jgi:hypothetical protein
MLDILAYHSVLSTLHFLNRPRRSSFAALRPLDNLLLGSI